jgi:hypothetical protein
MSCKYHNQIQSLNRLSTVEVLRLIIFLHESLHPTCGKASLLFMIDALLQRVREDTIRGLGDAHS